MIPGEELGEIGLYIDRTYKVVRQDLLRQFRAAKIDITPEQWVVLSRLAVGKKLSQTEIGNQTFKDKHTLSRIIDLLNKKGYVKRRVTSADKRKAIIELTAAGEMVLNKAKKEVLKSRERGWKNISKTEYQQLVKTLNKIFVSYLDK